MLKRIGAAIYNSSSSINLIGQVIWFFCFVMTALNETHLINSAVYPENKGIFWFIGLVAYIVGFLFPCKEISNRDNNIFTSLFMSVFWILQFCVAVAVISFVRIDDFIFTDDHLIQTLTSFFAAAAVAIGWLVHAHTQKNALRRQHTVNVLNSSRMSEVYQEKLEQYNQRYTQYREISELDVKTYLDNRKGNKENKENKEGVKDSGDEAEAIKSIRAAIYLLNFYEFIAVGISKGDLDDDYLYETVSYITFSLRNTSQKLILELRKDEQSVFEHLDKMLARWEGITQERKKERLS